MLVPVSVIFVSILICNWHSPIKFYTKKKLHFLHKHCRFYTHRRCCSHDTKNHSMAVSGDARLLKGLLVAAGTLRLLV